MTTSLYPATSALAKLVRGVRDEQLGDPTPCGELTVGDLLDHVKSFSYAFAAAALKERSEDGNAAPEPDAARLGTDWRERLPARLERLAAAWDAAEAWSGETVVGGGRMPAQVAGAAAADELIVHGWEVAVATGQPYPGDDPAMARAMQTAYAWVESVVAQNPDGTPGLFGPPLRVAADAPALDRLLALCGRDPRWPRI